jgi:hypothetical protein
MFNAEALNVLRSDKLLLSYKINSQMSTACSCFSAEKIILYY